MASVTEFVEVTEAGTTEKEKCYLCSRFLAKEYVQGKGKQG